MKRHGFALFGTVLVMAAILVWGISGACARSGGSSPQKKSFPASGSGGFVIPEAQQEAHHPHPYPHPPQPYPYNPHPHPYPRPPQPYPYNPHP
ncbi:MAG TPA: hypothetical protein PK364_02205, partial [Synergistaceae bacterium]|nr:hypothetical protein [Synergistaceae bacterium]